MPYATAVLMGVGAFFVGLALFASNPFEQLSPAPLEGAGLNPLLRHPAMLMHPPMLYSGYVFFTVPFAFAVGALITRRVDASWIRVTRRFALIAWTFLSIGIVLGASWSYSELGWGGYWAWDPVENASLMPWLMGTAFLHSIMVQEKRGMLKVWNVSLIVGTFTLALLGTFLVRSGVLQSIHAFGASTVGAPILVLIAVVLIGSTALIVSRLDDLRSEKRIDSLFSRESIFLVNNFLLVALCAVIFWGTMFPLIAELFTGNKASLAAPWFDRYTTPLAIMLVLFTGIGPLLAWRRVTWESARRVFVAPAAVALGVGVGTAILFDTGRRPWALLLFAFSAFALTALAQELWRGGAARRALSGGSIPGSIFAVASRNRRRYGGYIVHAGIAVLLIGVAASSSFQTNREVNLRPGDSTSVDGYKVDYKKPTVNVDNERIAFGALLDVSKGSQRFTIHPTRGYFRPDGCPPQTADQLLLRRRVDQRGGAAPGSAKRLLDRGAAQHRPGDPQRSRRGPQVPAPRPRPHALGGCLRKWGPPAAPGGDPSGRAGPGDPEDRQRLSARHAPRRLSRDRQPARHLDVDRRGGGPLRGADRGLADPRRSPPPRHLPAGRTAQPRAVARPRLSGHCSRSCSAQFCSSSWRPSCWCRFAASARRTSGWTRGSPIWSPARRPSTARFATPSSITRPGKLSDEDFRRQDAELRREAVEILKRLDRAQGKQAAGNAGGEEP